MILFLFADSLWWAYKRKKQITKIQKTTKTSISCHKVLLKLHCHQIFKTILCLRKKESSPHRCEIAHSQVSIAVCFYLFIKHTKGGASDKRSIKVLGRSQKIDAKNITGKCVVLMVMEVVCYQGKNMLRAKG